MHALERARAQHFKSFLLFIFVRIAEVSVLVVLVVDGSHTPQPEPHLRWPYLAHIRTRHVRACVPDARSFTAVVLLVYSQNIGSCVPFGDIISCLFALRVSGVIVIPPYMWTARRHHIRKIYSACVLLADWTSAYNRRRSGIMCEAWFYVRQTDNT